MKLTLQNPKIFSDIVTIISELVTEVRLKITKENLSLTAIDPANVAMVHFKLPASLFSEFELEKEEDQAKKQAKVSVQNLKTELTLIEQKLEKLLDACLGEIISAEEYAPRKQKLLAKKLELQDKIRDFEQNGLSWFEPAREFVKSLNQAANLLESENYSEISTFLKNTGSNHILHDRQPCFV